MGYTLCLHLSMDCTQYILPHRAKSAAVEFVHVMLGVSKYKVRARRNSRLQQGELQASDGVNLGMVKARMTVD